MKIEPDDRPGGVPMENVPSTAILLRKVALWTLIGVGVIFLSGPVLTIIGVILPFALVGALVWLVIRAIIAGPRAVGRTIRTVGGGALRVVAAGPRWAGRQLGRSARFLGVAALTSVAFLGRLLFPTLAGAILGAVLGVIGGIQHDDADVRVPAGAVIGAGVGLLAGFVWRKPASKAQTAAARAAQKAEPPEVIPVLENAGFNKSRIPANAWAAARRPEPVKPKRPPGVAKVVLVSETRE
jgi:hypothetical protein